MENNCLVTKLKAVVDNTDLPVLNGIILHVMAENANIDNNLYVSGFLSPIPPTDIRFSDGNNHFCNLQGELVPIQDIPKNYGGIYFKPGDYYVTIPNVSLLSNFSFSSSSATNWKNPYFSFDVNSLINLKNAKVIMIDFSDNRLIGNINVLKNIVNCTQMTGFPIGLVGNIDDLVRHWCLNGRTSTSNVTISKGTNTAIKYYSDYSQTESSTTTLSDNFKAVISENAYQLRELTNNTLISAWKYSGGVWSEDTSVS